MDFKDYYKILGVEPTADDKTIKTAYRKLARKYHPDVSKEPGAEDKFKEASEAVASSHHPAGRDVAALARDLVAADSRTATFRTFSAPSLASANGQRMADITKTLNVKIPAGVTDGERIRLKGQGAPGIAGGEKGDLYLIIRLAPHPMFDVEGHDLIITVPIAPWEAALGTKVAVPTLTGKINLTIRPDSQNGQRLRVKGNGLLNKQGQRGDLFAQIKIVMPKSTDEATKEFCEVVGMPAAFVIEIVEHGILEPQGRRPDEWVFDGASLSIAKRAVRLHHQLQLEWDGVALALNLLEELEREPACWRMRQPMRCNDPGLWKGCEYRLFRWPSAPADRRCCRWPLAQSARRRYALKAGRGCLRPSGLRSPDALLRHAARRCRSVWLSCRRCIDGFAAGQGHFHRLAIHWQCHAQAAADELQQIADHRPHQQTAALDAFDGSTQIMAEDGEEDVARARHAFGVCRCGLGQCFIDGLVEADHVRQVTGLRLRLAFSPEPHDGGAQVTEFGGHLHQIKSDDMPQFAVAGGSLIQGRGLADVFALSLGDALGLGLRGVHVARCCQQDRPGVVAQLQRTHRMGCRRQGCREPKHHAFARASFLSRLAVQLEGCQAANTFPSVDSPLKQKIPLRHRQDVGRLAPQQHAVGLDLIGLRVDVDVGQVVVVDQVCLGHIAAALDHTDLFLQTQLFRNAGIEGCLADEGQAAGVQRATVAGEHRTVMNRLRGRNRGVCVAHQAGGNRATFEDQRGFYSEKRRTPEHQVCPFTHFDRTHFVADAVSDSRVDGVLGDVAFGAEVVVAFAVTRQCAALAFHFVGGLPGAHDHLANPAHGLAVGAEHRERAQVMQDVFGGNGLAADAAFGERDVLGDAGVEVMADHQHVQVLVDGVAGERAGRVGRAGQHVGKAARLDDVRCMAATGAFGVVGVDGAVLERRQRGFDEAGFVQGVSVDRHLNIILIGDAQAVVDGRRRRAPVFVQLEADGPGLDLLDQRLGQADVALAGKADVHGERLGGLQHAHHVPLAGLINDQRVGDQRVDYVGGDALTLTHAVTDDLAATELHFFAINGEVLLYLDPQFGVRQTHTVADGGAEHIGVGLPGNFHLFALNSMDSETARGARFRCRRNLRELLQGVSRYKSPITRPANPKTRRNPARSTSSTSRACPGSKRTAVPAGMFRRMPRLAVRSNVRASLVSKK
nr:chaperone protein DnaJ A6, chloroplastic [Tanacetum cinerariifolium]